MQEFWEAIIVNVIANSIDRDLSDMPVKKIVTKAKEVENLSDEEKIRLTLDDKTQKITEAMSQLPMRGLGKLIDRKSKALDIISKYLNSLCAAFNKILKNTFTGVDGFAKDLPEMFSEITANQFQSWKKSVGQKYELSLKGMIEFYFIHSNGVLQNNDNESLGAIDNNMSIQQHRLTQLQKKFESINNQLQTTETKQGWFARLFKPSVDLQNIRKEMNDCEQHLKIGLDTELLNMTRSFADTIRPRNWWQKIKSWVASFFKTKNEQILENAKIVDRGIDFIVKTIQVTASDLQSLKFVGEATKSESTKVKEVENLLETSYCLVKDSYEEIEVKYNAEVAKNLKLEEEKKELCENLTIFTSECQYLTNENATLKQQLAEYKGESKNKKSFEDLVHSSAGILFKLVDGQETQTDEKESSLDVGNELDAGYENLNFQKENEALYESLQNLASENKRLTDENSELKQQLAEYESKKNKNSTYTYNSTEVALFEPANEQKTNEVDEKLPINVNDSVFMA